MRIRAVLKELLSLSSRPVTVVDDPTRQRPSDLPILAASLAKTKRRIGWRAEIPLAVTLADTLDYWRMYGDEK